jgi:hypothetical protein
MNKEDYKMSWSKAIVLGILDAIHFFAKIILMPPISEEVLNMNSRRNSRKIKKPERKKQCSTNSSSCRP